MAVPLYIHLCPFSYQGLLPKAFRTASFSWFDNTSLPTAGNAWNKYSKVRNVNIHLYLNKMILLRSCILRLQSVSFASSSPEELGSWQHSANPTGEGWAAAILAAAWCPAPLMGRDVRLLAGMCCPCTFTPPPSPDFSWFSTFSFI